MAVPDVREMLRLLDENREAEAIAQLEAARPSESTSAAVHVLLARAYERTGRLADAMESWSTALFLAPESATARSGVRRMRRLYPELATTRASRPRAAATPPDPGLSPENHRPPSIGPAPSSPRRSFSNGDTEEHLDRLIRELEEAPRIVPDPDLVIDESDFEEEDDGEGLVSETLARIYAAQQQYREAAQVYELLAEQQPDRAGEFRQKAQEMKMRGRG